MVWVATFAGMRSSRSSLFLWTSVVVFSMLLHINGQCFATAAPSTHGAGVVPGVASAVPWMRDVVAELEGERFHATPQLSSVSSAATPDDILRGGGSVSVWNSERCRAHYLRRLASLDSGGNANNVDARSNRRVSGDSDSWLTRVDGDGVLSHAREVKDGGVLVTIEDVVNCVPDDAQVPRLPGLPITKKEKENSYLCGFEVSDEDLKDRMSPDRSHWPCHVLPLAKAPVTPLSVRRCTDIVISKEFRFIYIDNVKAGSSTVRAMLQNVFHYSARSAARLKPRKPQEFFIRSDNHILSCYLTATSSLSNGELTKNHATGLHEFNPDDYFVFSFVRDPRSRFFSGFGQADWQICRETPGTESGNFRALTQFRRGKTDAEVYSARVASSNKHTHKFRYTHYARTHAYTGCSP
eukprot:TRINITY_DN4322_c0_g1_i3.p1 TRINITY_DN4322_c0_g1~~TRINITY_DN4322_c0_g1_i3.p1  ORF type:complete len:410 (+),score=27.07 TRINITY_DN4322_c0_g1_i3:121-1350(+)